MLGSTSSLVSEEGDDDSIRPRRRYRINRARAMKNVRYQKVSGYGLGPDKDILNYAYGSETNLER
jgi:hypothetical protein